jgi:hypothetical protein
MTDALRSDRAGDAPDRERDTRIEELLLSGLEHYFAGQHELAINVWTRVLFLDRSHARARAYIERARGAVAEKQREGEELVHAAAAALERGDRVAARQLVNSAIDRGTSTEEALALLHRLDRLDAASSQSGQPAAVRRASLSDGANAGGARGRDQRVAWVAAGLLSGALLAMVGTYVWVVADPLGVHTIQVSGPAVADDPLPVPPACEIRLTRARDLYAKGRLHEAAAELGGGDPDECHRATIDDLRAAIQRQLLNAARAASSGPGAPPPPQSSPR